MSTSRGPYLTMGPQLTPVVKVLIISCAGMFLLSTLGGAQSEIFRFLGLVPYAVVSKFFLWQPVTYLFLHANLGHVFWNMFALWMFGCELERTWGSREFLRFFLITGVGAGLLSIILNPFSPIPTVGASGAIYGILAAFGLLFPERVVLLFFVFPVKVKYVVIGLAALSFYFALNSPGSTISHIAHLGGMLVGFLYLKGWLSWAQVRQRFYRWKIRRMRSKFEVYENPRKPKKKSRKDDFWIN